MDYPTIGSGYQKQSFSHQNQENCYAQGNVSQIISSSGVVRLSKSSPTTPESKLSRPYGSSQFSSSSWSTTLLKISSS
ncbi:hypothetical protein GcM3_029028 [Golovinomyces cichoracearum]|uniref:Uncharacterized protein n=1 Tax=Golovinomyces cichoracearum TaxID=62708 RepID=A0A420J578_9PEZI|nr:hypothetical protein GcM3_029028 [Golovinomyces cichoracearum]